MRRFVGVCLRFCLVAIVFVALDKPQLACATIIRSKASEAQAMRAYVSAIRYFNPGIDEDEARKIVVAIARESITEGVDPRLVVAIVETESSFDRTARSSAGARGLGQLMPSTAADDNVGNVEDIRSE